jgi:predicted transcriptional regulator|tara:strand:+ start:706 stop:957 length:252 start_codon:yes stop_codon:yes gene_type:complete
MKENKLIELKNRVESLTRIVKHLLEEVNSNATMVKGTLTAFQLHIGEEEWKKLVNELKDKEKRIIDELKEEKEKENLPPSQRK